VVTIDHSLVLDATPAEVFEYFTEPEKATAWQSSLVEARFDPEGPMRRGTRITEVRKLLGRSLESVVEVTELEAPCVFAGQVLSGPVAFAFRHRLEDTGGGTRLDAHLEGDPGRFFRLAEPLVVRALRRQLESDLATLKAIVEG
jgi:Polyketide cyclase / dehydrase and lipid transport